MGKKRDSSTPEYEVKYKRSKGGVQEKYRGSTGGVQEEYEGSIRGVRTPRVALFSLRIYSRLSNEYKRKKQNHKIGLPGD